MTKTKRKPVEKVEEPTIEAEPLVTSEEQVIPESTDAEVIVFEKKEDANFTLKPESQLVEESTVESVVSDVADGMVTAKAIVRNISFIDPVDGDIKHYKKGEVFTTTKERVDSLDQRHIEIL